MRFSTILCALVAPLLALGSGQINLWVSPRITFLPRFFTWSFTHKTFHVVSYYDDFCQNYAGSAFPDRYVTVGGPFGSRSMLWVSKDPCSRTCGTFFSKPPDQDCLFLCDEGATELVLESICWSMILEIGYLKFCKNPECNAWDQASGFGQCKHYENGVWGQQGCGCIWSNRPGATEKMTTTCLQAAPIGIEPVRSYSCKHTVEHENSLSLFVLIVDCKRVAVFRIQGPTTHFY